LKQSYFKILKNLEIFLNICKFFRRQIFYYIQIIQSLQSLKTFFFKNASKKDKARKNFTKKIVFSIFTKLQFKFFELIKRKIESRKILYHVDYDLVFTIYIDISRKFNIDMKIFQQFKNIVDKNLFDRSIMFLFHFFKIVEKYYWFTNFEIAKFI